MRLSHIQINRIVAAITPFIQQSTQLRLYGSRVDDALRGGDIDLMVYPDSIKLYHW